jgi:hypothetical protein
VVQAGWMKVRGTSMSEPQARCECLAWDAAACLAAGEKGKEVEDTNERRFFGGG